MGFLDDLKKKAEQAAKMELNHIQRMATPSTLDKQAIQQKVFSALTGRDQTFTFQSLPQTLDEMLQLPEIELTSPFQGAALTVLALCAFASNEQAGVEMLNYLKGPQPLSTYDIQFLRDRFNYMSCVPFSFFEGTSPENDYTPAAPYRLRVFTQPNTQLGGDRVTLFLKSSGADIERPVTLRRKGDQYFLWEQHLLSGIRTPKSADPWA